MNEYHFVFVKKMLISVLFRIYLDGKNLEFIWMVKIK